MGSCVENESVDPVDKIRSTYIVKFGFEPDPLNIVYSNDWSHYTSTCYHEGQLYRIYLNDAGYISSRTIEPDFPAGEKKVLAIIPVYNELLPIEDFDSIWKEEQDRINQEHLEFSTSRSYGSPIVYFDNYNLYINPSDIDFEGSGFLKDSIKRICRSHNLNYDDFDYKMYIDLDQDHSTGGWADYKNGVLRMGWFYETTAIDKESIAGIANACYHHEVGHLWGWEHAWSDASRSDNFITDPLLFGWEDMDGDKRPDINN